MLSKPSTKTQTMARRPKGHQAQTTGKRRQKHGLCHLQAERCKKLPIRSDSCTKTTRLQGVSSPCWGFSNGQLSREAAGLMPCHGITSPGLINAAAPLQLLPKYVSQPQRRNSLSLDRGQLFKELSIFKSYIWHYPAKCLSVKHQMYLDVWPCTTDLEHT